MLKKISILLLALLIAFSFVACDDEKVSEEVIPEYEAKIGDAKYDTLTEAIEAAASGDTIILVRDATGKGIGSKDGSKARENLTIDFNNHTYTMLNPAVGSKGTETQAMHWGTTLGKITMKNGTFKVDNDATQVKMAMQNYIDFDAVNMIFDFTSIPVVHYGDNEFTGTEYESYNGKEVPLFNNNSGKMLLDSCTVKMPAESNKGISVEGDGVTLKDCKIEGYLNLPSAGIELTVQGSTTITGKVVDYFTDEVIEPTTEGENTIYKK